MKELPAFRNWGHRIPDGDKRHKPPKACPSVTRSAVRSHMSPSYKNL